MKTELQLPSDLKYIEVAEGWLFQCLKLELGNSVDWDNQTKSLRLVLVEAYSNVVRHAHQGKAQIPVWLRLELKEREMALEIWDCGEGYDLSTYCPPEPEALQEQGYGLLIVTQLMDRVEYRLQVNGRNCLKLEKSL